MFIKKKHVTKYHVTLATKEGPNQRCAGSGVQESTPARVSAFQLEQDQDRIFLIGTGAGIIFNHSIFEILMSFCTLRDYCDKS